MTDKPSTGEPVVTLKPCPFCGTSEHLSFQWPGSMTTDMPDRPCRVVCTHIDHDTVTGPTAYGKFAARAAWNTRASHTGDDGLAGERDRVEYFREVLDKALDAAKVVEVCAVLATKYDKLGNVAIANGLRAKEHRTSAAYERHMVRISQSVADLTAALTPPSDQRGEE